MKAWATRAARSTRYYVPHNARLLFLDADDDLLVRRFSQTRRRHPFAQTGSVREAIEADRRVLAPLRERADVVIDTTNLTHGTLKERIATAFMRDRPVRLAVTFVAFGFKYGLPTDLDLLFDVRFLRNPNYEEALAEQTGRRSGGRRVHRRGSGARAVSRQGRRPLGVLAAAIFGRR